MREQSYTKNNSHQNNIKGGETKVMKKVLNILLVLALIFTMVSPAFAAANTTQEKFDELKAANVLSGDANGNMLALDSNMDRQQLAKIACTLAGVAATPGVSIAAFADDYKLGVWGFEQGWIQAAYTAGLMQGKGAAGFDAKGQVTVAELLAVTLRSMGTLTANVDETKNPWYTDYMTIATQQGMVPAGAVSPTDPATYAALVTQAHNSYAYNNVPAVLEVVSATAINSSQVAVVFNKAVTKLSAEAVGNYQVNGTTFATSTLFGGVGSIATLSADGKTVILEARTALLPNNQSFELKISGVTDTSYQAITTSYKTVTGQDTTAPSIVSITSTAGLTGTNKVAVKLSEPVLLGSVGAYQVNGINATATIDAKDKSLINLVTGASLAAGSSNTLSVVGLTEGINTTAQIVQTFTVGTDQNAVSVVSATQVGSNIKVVFDKPMNSANFASLTRGTTALDDISLTKQAVAVTYINVAPTLDPMDSTNKTVIFTVNTGIYGSASSANAVFSIKGLEDIYGNAMTPYSSTMTLVKDVTAPTLSSAVLDTSDNKTIYMSFSEEIADPNLTISAMKVIDNSTAIDVTATILFGAGAGDDIVTSATFTALPGGVTNSPYVKVVLPVALTAGKTYTISVPSSTVLDVAGNSMSATSFNLTAVAGADSTKPTVVKNAVTDINLVGGQNVLHVTYSENVQLADAVNTSNYVLNGSTLPAGTIITNESAVGTDTKDFAITLPKVGVTADVAASLVVTSVRDKAGNSVLPTTLVSWSANLKDTKIPSFVKAEATGDTELVLTFDEPIALVGDGGAGVEITVTDNTTTASIDLDADNVTYLGNTATITLAGDNLGDINFASAFITYTATAIVDRAATPNAALVTVAGDFVLVTDKFVDVTGGSVAVTDGTGTDETFSEVAVNITATTYNAVDKIVRYEVYIVDATNVDYTTVAQVESNLNKIATLLPSNCGVATDLTSATSIYLSDGTTLISTFNATVDTYIIAVDQFGNKGLISQLPSGGAINVAD